MSYTQVATRTTDDANSHADINQLQLNIEALKGGTGTDAPVTTIDALNDFVEDFSANIMTELNATGDAPIYACRAWVNFSGVPLTGTYSQTSNVVTVTITNHGLSTGMKVNVTPTSGTGVAGTYNVNVSNANTYTYTAGQQQSTSGNITQNLYIRASGNVSSVIDEGTGKYTINFTTPMPDVNYSVVGSAIDFRLLSISDLAVGSVRVRPTYQIDTGPEYSDQPYILIAIFR